MELINRSPEKKRESWILGQEIKKNGIIQTAQQHLENRKPSNTRGTNIP